jgi:hypothetical protein
MASAIAVQIAQGRTQSCTQCCVARPTGPETGARPGKSSVDVGVPMATGSLAGNVISSA